MRGKRVLGENSCRRSFSKKTNSINNGKAIGTPEKVVLIDLDDDVVIIDDAPESLDKNFGTSETPRHCGNTHVESVINIDDDDCDDDEIEVVSGIGVVADDADLASDANSSQSRFPTVRTKYRDAGDCEFVTKKATTFQFSKCKRKYFSKPPTKNRFGLNPTADDVSTDSDSSDCEIGSDSEGWNRAALRRKHPQNLSSVFEDQTSVCESNNGEERHPRPTSGKADRVDENQADFVASGGGYVNTSSYRTSPVSYSMDVDYESEERDESVPEKEPPLRNENFQPEGSSGSGSGADEDVYDGTFGNKVEEPCPQQSFTEPEECYSCKSLSCRCKPMNWGWEEPSASVSPFGSFEHEVSDKQATPPRTPSMEKNNLDSRQAIGQNSSLFNGTQVNVDHSLDGIINCGSGYFFSRHVDSEGTTVHRSTQDQPNVNFKGVYGNVECAQEDHITPPVETCIITDRQKLKDTEEFRRANEEEWAARQRELRSQAEEAQKLRRRKKAETLRLNNIERRQKERLEEVRENQKKNAEDINLKEQLRGEIRKEINKLEITCFDMASLLRGLGIPVNGGFKPMSQDVNAAYKRALLKFHPDRASRMDIRQQVESEEKFKLISRMKEKFLTSCC